MLKDALGRELRTLRISVTDRCDLRCRYCAPACGVRFQSAEQLLTTPELLRLARAFAGEGITRFKLTGGEPLLRDGLPDVVEALAGLPTCADLSLTTNGMRLKELAPALRRAGLRRVTVSLDSLDAEVFGLMTRGGSLGAVLEGIAAAEEEGFSPLKLNCVVLREWNAERAYELAAMTLSRDREVRFIEYMPMGMGTGLSRSAGVNNQELRAGIARKLGPLEEVAVGASSPARVYRLCGAKGRIGFISALSGRFCGECDRLRLEADGFLRLCMAEADGVDLRGPLRGGASNAELGALIRQAAWRKPAGHDFLGRGAGTRLPMNRIGG